MLTEQELKTAARIHFEAEAARDVDMIADTVDDHVEYHVVSPFYPDDPRAEHKISGKQAVRDLWTGYYELFGHHHIECLEDEMITFPEKGLVFCNVRITTTPSQDFEGFPAGKPFSYTVGAMCSYNEAGKMTSETVYGSMGKVLGGIRRMHDFLAEEQARSAAA